MKLISLLPMLIVLPLFSFAGPSQRLKDRRASTTKSERLNGESKTWRLKIVSVERKASPTPNAEPQLTTPNHYMLRLALEVTYLGEDAKIDAPKLIVIDSKNQKYTARNSIQTSPEVDDIEMFKWFIRGTPRLIKKGENFKGWIAFYFEIPEEVTELKLVFDDIPPIIFGVRNTQK